MHGSEHALIALGTCPACSRIYGYMVCLPQVFQEVFKRGVMVVRQVHRIPSILVALPRPATEEQKQAGQSGIAMSFQPYTGPIKYSSIYEWLRMMAVVTGKLASSVDQLSGV